MFLMILKNKSIKRMKINNVIKFYQETTPEEKCHFLNMIAKNICVPVQKEDGCHVLELDEETPICMNGTFYQINTEEFYKDEKIQK